jgi:hypothetical protein
MARLIDVWRAVDPEARLAAGDPGDALALVRGISRTRAAPPHLPPPAEGHLLVVDAALLAVLSPERLLAEVAASGSTPVGVLLAAPAGEPGEWPPESPPILVSRRSAASLAADGST